MKKEARKKSRFGVWWFLTDVKFLLILGASIIVISIIVSIKTCDGHWFQRSGAILVISGVLLSSRRIIRKNSEELRRAEEIINGGTFVEAEEQKEEKKQIRRDINAFKIGPWFLLLGTLIWAYGDLLGSLFWELINKIL